jgi:hypothetical protein
MPKTYNNVQFYFSTLDGNYDEETGTVLVRPGEMVIDIPGSYRDSVLDSGQAVGELLHWL